MQITHYHRGAILKMTSTGRVHDYFNSICRNRQTPQRTGLIMACAVPYCARHGMRAIPE